MWKIKINEVGYPSRTSVRVAFTLFKDDTTYINDEVTLLPEELEKVEDKEQFILDKISDKLKAYMATDKVVSGIDELKDKEYEVGKDDSAMISAGLVAAKEAEISNAEAIN